MAIIYPMHLHNDSSLSDLLPWQTSETHSPQINFIHSHLAAIAKMGTPKPEKRARPQLISQQKRHTTLITTSPSRKGQQQPLIKSQNQSRVNTINPQKLLQNNLLHQSLQEDRLEKIMQTSESSSPIRVAQINTEQTTLSSSRKDLQGGRLRYNSEKGLRNTLGGDTKKVSQKMTFAQFLLMKNKEERGKKTSVSKERDVLLYRECEFGIHVRAMEQKQIHFHQSDTSKVGDGGRSSLTVLASRSVKDRRKLVSSKKVRVKLKEVQCLSNEMDFSQNFNAVWIHT